MTQFEAVLERMRDMARRENVACGLNPWPVLPVGKNNEGPQSRAKTEERRKAVRQMRLDGAKLKQIATTLGLSMETVKHDLHAMRRAGHDRL